jgi:acyl-CoA synthetase (AMP-forming)/AMP-acid ligase II
MGVQKGDVIGILSWNRLEYTEVFGAAMKGGFVLAHYNPRLHGEELVHVINDSEPGVLFVGPELAGTLKEVHKHLPSIGAIIAFADAKGRTGSYAEFVRVQSTEEPARTVRQLDPLTIFYTSGTTGMPRGAIYTHGQKLENARMKAFYIGVQTGDRHIDILPMFHIGGDSHIWPFFLTGGCNVIMPASCPLEEVLKTIPEEQITDLHIVPTQLVSLLDIPDLDRYDLHCLKRIWYAASPMPTEVLKRGLSVFGPIFIQSYGQTETGPEVTVLSRADHCYSGDSEQAQGVLASCGRPCIDVHVRIVDDDGRDVEVGKIGEIIVQSKRIMTGFYRRPEETRDKVRDGWLYTGDLGYFDERGYIYIADRKADRIITGGENVYPVEVENVLYQHPAVKEAAVIGVPDRYWIERVHALVVVKKDAQVTEEEMINFCRDHIAHYKAPKTLEFVEDLPKNPQGKILKRKIRAQYQE